MWDDFNQHLDDLRRLGRYRELRSTRHDGVYLTDAEGNQRINFGSNDYLGLSSLLATKLSATQTIGSTASGLVCGWTDRHQVLAEKIADFEQTESAIVFASGFAACSGIVASLCRRGDLILSDELNHASLIDGCRLSRAECIVYPHRDVEAVDRLLASHRQAHVRVWIVTDSVFSMDGHVAPLHALSRIANRHDATMIVDEAHATGILGQALSGACEAFGVKDSVPIRIGTLSKAIGGQGGFVACPKVVSDFLINHCRPFIFSTALSLPAVESAILAFSNLDEMYRRRERVCELARQVRSALGPNPCHQHSEIRELEAGIPIIPVHIGSDVDAVAASQRLYELGMFVPAIRPPTVPEGQSRLRVSLSADHHDDMVNRLLKGLESL